MNFDKEGIKKNISLSMKNLHNPNKQILFDIDKDKYFLKNENSIKLYESNKFGQKKPKLNILQTGFAKYNERIQTNSIDKLNFNIDDSLYHPQSLLFEGYTQFPRPVVIPFSNITKIKLQKNLINNLKKNNNFLKTSKNKNILNKKTNEGLCFYSGTINNIVNKKNKQYVLDKINNALSYDENRNIFNKKDKISSYEKNSLKKLKNKILTNSTNTVFGRKLTKPDDKFIRQFNINYNIYFNNPIKKLLLNKKETEIDSKLYFKDLYRTLNKKSVQQRLNLSNNNLNIENINNHLKNQNISTDKDINLTKTKTTNYNEDKELSPIFTSYTTEDKNKNKKNLYKTNYINTDIPKIDTTKDYFSHIYKEDNNIFNTLENESMEKYKNLLSEDNERKNRMPISLYNKYNNYESNSINIKTLSDINKNCYLEKKLLKGFIKPKIKERNYRKVAPKYKSTINIYKKEWEIYKLVNPIRHKLDEEKQLKELKFIKDRLNKGKDMISFGIQK